MDPKILHNAAGGNDVAEVERLINLGVDVNIKNEYDLTALHFAAFENEKDSHFETIKLLLKNGADVNVRSSSGRTPIFELIFRSDFKTVKLLVDFGADLKVKDKNDFTPLFPAVFNNTIEVVKLFVENGADAGYRKKGHSIFNWACDGKPTEVVQIVKYLIKNGANLEANDNDSCPPLDPALESNSVPLIKFFCKYADFSFAGFQQYFKISNIEKKDIWMTLLKHLAKLEALDITANPIFFQEISKRHDFGVYFKECTEELVKAKNKKLKNSWVSYFNLLVDSKRKIKNYASNRDLIEDFKNSDGFKIFPIYGCEMQKNVGKAIKGRKAFDESAVALSNCLTILNPTHLIIRDVLDCITHKDYVVFLSEI